MGGHLCILPLYLDTPTKLSTWLTLVQMFSWEITLAGHQRTGQTNTHYQLSRQSSGRNNIIIQQSSGSDHAGQHPGWSLSTLGGNMLRWKKKIN